MDKSGVQRRYQSYSTNDNYHLYTAWKTTADDTAAGATTTGKNAYVEFRIIQVGEHDGDGSAVTFMATHSLPTAKQMNSSADNTDGWCSSAMRGYMSSYVASGLSDLANSDKVKSVNKITAYRASTSDSWSTDPETAPNCITSDQFWLLSHTEAFGNNTDNDNTLVPTYFSATEGSQYAWFSAQGVNAKLSVLPGKSR